MGDIFGDGHANEKPPHEVCVSGFYIGRYEVTQGQWKKVMGRNPSHFKECGDNCPVENVSWNNAQDFIRKLNSQSDKKYRLPTEAEWEYAARNGGKEEKFAGTNSENDLGDYAWYGVNSGRKTYKVGSKKPNGLGIHDMSGNVEEWCNDWYGENYFGTSPRDNPEGPSSGSLLSVRGGCWNYAAKHMRTLRRGRGIPDYRGGDLGFRLVLPKGQ